MRLIVFKSDVRDRVKVCSINSFEQLSHIQEKKNKTEVQKGNLQHNHRGSQFAT